MRKYDLFTQYALIAATQAVEDSGLDLEKEDLEQIGVIWSSGIGGLKTFFDECLGYAAGDGTPRFSPFFIPRMIADIAAGYISIKYGFMGPNYCTVSACASSNHGLIDSFNAIRFGVADVMVAGGSEAAVNEPSVGGFNSMQALSTRNDDPVHASRPFDKDRDGFVIGEGAGALILEEYEHAKRTRCEDLLRNGRRRPFWRTHITLRPPSRRQRRHEIHARRDQGCGYQTRRYRLCERTRHFDTCGRSARAQSSARRVRRSHLRCQYFIDQIHDGAPVGGCRCCRGAGLHLCDQQRCDSPTINNENLDPEIDPRLNLTLNKAQKRDVKCAMSNTFGFGGHNSTVIFRKI